MVDLIIENSWRGYMIYRILDGNKKAIVILTKENYKTLDEVMDIAIGADANDVIDNEESFVIYTEPEKFLDVKIAFEENGITEFIQSEVTYVPNNTISLNDEDTEKVMS